MTIALHPGIVTVMTGTTRDIYHADEPDVCVQPGDEFEVRPGAKIRLLGHTRIVMHIGDLPFGQITGRDTIVSGSDAWYRVIDARG